MPRKPRRSRSAKRRIAKRQSAKRQSAERQSAKKRAPPSRAYRAQLTVTSSTLPYRGGAFQYDVALTWSEVDGGEAQSLRGIVTDLATKCGRQVEGFLRESGVLYDEDYIDFVAVSPRVLRSASPPASVIESRCSWAAPDSVFRVRAGATREPTVGEAIANRVLRA